VVLGSTRVSTFQPKKSFHKKPFEHEIEVEGHLIDSMILTKIFDKIMDLEGDFKVIEFKIGKGKTDYSYARLVVKGRNEGHLRDILHELYGLGAVSKEEREVKLEPAPADMVLPDGFYSTANHPTFIYLDGKWVVVKNLMMDKAIVVDRRKSEAYCRAIREVKKNDLIVVEDVGIKIKPPERPREGVGVFEFMSSNVSSEKPSNSIIRRVAQSLYEIKRLGGKIVVVAGPAVVHTGSAGALARLIREGYVNALLAGNALAVHDVESALYGTSLGIRLTDGSSTIKGNRNHIAAINEVFKAGSLSELMRKGVLNSGIIYECVKNGVPCVLAGSIRDDGPLPDVITDVVEAQKKYKEALRGARVVLMLSTTLHSIAVGNMLPSDVTVVCVDINPSTVTKLLDRGTTQAMGLVSDIGTFLLLLDQELSRLETLNPAFPKC
jgi:lysine-ketoglutarate reductase/saccharopine dehydrogenase-like protein (TIGR00300 family)